MQELKGTESAWKTFREPLGTYRRGNIVKVSGEGKFFRKQLKGKIEKVSS
jgi:hypothetical protein